MFGTILGIIEPVFVQYLAFYLAQFLPTFDEQGMVPVFPVNLSTSLPFPQIAFQTC
jgi:hypothetical protein